MIAFAAYGALHASAGASGPLAHHRGSILYRDDAIGRSCFRAFRPLNLVLYLACDIDAEVHQGDCFWYEFCGEDHID